LYNLRLTDGPILVGRTARRSPGYLRGWTRRCYGRQRWSTRRVCAICAEPGRRARRT